MKKINKHQYSRPALKILWLLGTFIILAGMVTLSVFAAPSAIHEIDLSVEGNTEWVNGARLSGRKIAKGGTGVLDPFMQIKYKTGAGGVSYGYNYATDFYTSPPDPPLDEIQYVTAGETHSIKLSAIPQVFIGSQVYRQLAIDINENDELVSLDHIQIFTYSDPGPPDIGSHQFGYSAGPPPTLGATTLVWNLQADTTTYPDGVYLKIGTLGGGSGWLDAEFLIPNFGPSDCDFGSGSCTTWVYVWCQFGENIDQEDGFEEWSIGVQGPLAVTLVSSAAEATIPGEIKVDWTTASEVNTAGFNLYRSTGPSGEKQFLDFIPSESPGSIGMGTYQYVDTDVQASVGYTYWLEEQTLDGTEGYVQQLQATGLWGYVFIPMITR